VQGRVFGVIDQIVMLLTPIAYLFAGPLADQVFEPLVATPAWEPFAPFFGAGAGAGMGLLFAISGLLTFATVVLARFNQTVWTMETTLPDYLPEEAEEPIVEIAVAAA